MDAEYHARRLELAEELLLPKVESGELWAIQNLLLLVSEAIADGVSLNPRIATYISGALRQIHGGENADDAFGIKRKKGEKDNRQSRRRAHAMTDAVARLRQLDNMTLESATALVAEKFSISEDSVKGNWKKHHKDVEDSLKLELDTFGEISMAEEVHGTFKVK